MELVDVEEVYQKYPYLVEEGVKVESAIRNDNTLCVTLSLKVAKLIEIVDCYNWQCIFDRGIGEDIEIFTCIARKE